MTFSLLDFAFLGIFIVSSAIGAFRGFVRSFLSVVFWIAAAWISWQYGQVFSNFLVSVFEDSSVRLIISHIGLFFFVLLVGAILNAVIANAIVSPGIASVDRTLGTAFGLLRGGVLVLFIALVGSIGLFQGQSWWEDSIVVTITEPYINQIRDVISDAIALPQNLPPASTEN